MSIERHFRLLRQQRETFYNDPAIPFERLWARPRPEKWSIGETLYHLFLMMRLFRQFSRFYIPLLTPIAKVSKNSYPVETYDIYKEYQKNKLKGMRAPRLIQPPKDLPGTYELADLQQMLQTEADKLYQQVEQIDDRTAGHIVYFDPVAHHPNLIQSIHLLAIHEQHHFDLTKHYFWRNRPLKGVNRV